MTNTSKPSTKANLWYKNYLVLIFVIGLPVFVVIICLFFIFYSIKIQDATVRDDWYMDGKTLYQDASRDQLSYDLGVFGVMRLSDFGEQTKIYFELNYPKQTLATGQFNDGTPLSFPDTLNVSISHATDKSKDRDVIIKHLKDNIYTGEVSLDVSLDKPAKYYLQVSTDDTHNWRLVQHEKLPKNNISFSPLPSFAKQSGVLPDQKNQRPSQK